MRPMENQIVSPPALMVGSELRLIGGFVVYLTTGSIWLFAIQPAWPALSAINR